MGRTARLQFVCGDPDRLLVIDQMIHILDDDVRDFSPALYME